MNKNRKLILENRLLEAKRLKAISNTLYGFCYNYLLEGDTDFDIIYLSGREKYIGVRINSDLGRKTANILLKNGFKQECLQLKRNKFLQ